MYLEIISNEEMIDSTINDIPLNRSLYESDAFPSNSVNPEINGNSIKQLTIINPIPITNPK